MQLVPGVTRSESKDHPGPTLTFRWLGAEKKWRPTFTIKIQDNNKRVIVILTTLAQSH
jgi:hypothetical protein